MLAARKKLLDHAKQSAAEALFTTLKKVVQQTGKVAGDLIGNKIADKITKFQRTVPQKTSVIVRSNTGNIRFDDKIPKERYIY